MADIPEWHQQLQHLQARLEGLAQQQIQGWAERWDHTFHQQATSWRTTGQEWREIDRWGHGPVRTLVPKEPRQILEDRREAISALQRTREWLAANPLEEVQARLQQSAERAREALHQTRHVLTSTAEQPQAWDAGDPDYLGWQAEQRFSQEQDPARQWYREDLYHGEPGPDVAIDLAEEEMRQRAQHMQEPQSGEHYEQTRTALQEALGEALGLLHEPHPHSAEYLDAEAQAAELRQALQDLDRAEHRAQALEFERQELAYDERQRRIAAGEPLRTAGADHWEHPLEFPTAAEQQAYEDRPYVESEERAHFGEEMERSLPSDAILVDTSNPEMEEDFQALLARLDQRLDALVQETASEAQRIHHQQGVRY